MAKTRYTRLGTAIYQWLKALGLSRIRSAGGADAYLQLILSHLSAKPAPGQKVILYARSAAAPEEERAARLKAQLGAC